MAKKAATTKGSVKVRKNVSVKKDGGKKNLKAEEPEVIEAEAPEQEAAPVTEEESPEDEAPEDEAPEAEIIEGALEVLEGGKIDQAESLKVLEQIRSVRDRMDRDYFEMAALLYATYNQQLYAHWGYESFKEFVGEELEFSIRKAQYLVGIHHYFVNDLGDPDLIDKVRELGWSKAKELREVITQDNADEWIDRATTMNVSDLASEAKKALQGSGEFDDDGEGDPTPDKDQVHSVKINFVGDQYENFIAATERAMEMTNSDKTNHLVDLICSDWLGSNAFMGEGRDAHLAAYLKKNEGLLGLRFFALDPKTDTIVYGEEDGVRVVVLDMEKNEIWCGEDVLEEIMEDEDDDDEGVDEPGTEGDEADDDSDNKEVDED